MRQLWLAGAMLLLLSISSSLPAQEKAENVGKTWQVPYRLTIPKHVMIRAKINGKGPYNFILDTGAPALFVATKVAKDLGVPPDKNGWGSFDTFEIEGGVVFKKAKGRIEDPFQLEGMNAMGLAGAELHGVVGYNLLAQYRMTFDFTKNKMEWTKLDYVPKAPMGIGRKGGGQGGMEAFGQIMKMVGGLLGRKAKPTYVSRGFLGIEVSAKESLVSVDKVLTGSPAEKAGIKAGDRLRKVNGRTVYGVDGLSELVGKVQPGEKVSLRVLRGEKDEEINLELTAGEGL